MQVASAEEMPQRIAAIWDGPRSLSNELLARLYVFRETDSQRIDVHLMILVAHCVTDAVGNRSLMGVFLDALAPREDPDWGATGGEVGNDNTLFGAGDWRLPPFYSN